jgi:hypothetical protein
LKHHYWFVFYHEAFGNAQTVMAASKQHFTIIHEERDKMRKIVLPESRMNNQLFPVRLDRIKSWQFPYCSPNFHSHLFVLQAVEVRNYRLILFQSHVDPSRFRVQLRFFSGRDALVVRFSFRTGFP